MKAITIATTSNDRVTIPAEVRDHLDVKAGDKIVFVIEDDGTIRLRKVRASDSEDQR